MREHVTDFVHTFGAAPQVTARAPGRVNLIGEHTDYNGGFVLPVALPQHTTAHLSPHAGKTVRAASVDRWTGQPLVYELGAEARRGGWLDYVQGVTQVLAQDCHPLTGFDLLLESDVPIGSGLSSSAALEVALLRALRAAFALPIDDVGVARYGQRAENGLVGAVVGIMDQMAASVARPGAALFLDTCSLAYEQVPLPAAAELLVIDSGIAHSNVSGGYAERRAQCEQAAALLGVALLRDVTPEDLPQVERLPEPLRRRARHVVTEDARVLQAVAALRAEDLPALGALLWASHESLRDDYQVSLPEIDLMVHLARTETDIYGARLTGGGFGGAVVGLARRGSAAQAARRIARLYAERTGRHPAVLLPENLDDPAVGGPEGSGQSGEERKR